MTRKQPFNPIPLILIGITSGGFALVSILFINWKGAEIESTNNPKRQAPIQITIPSDTAKSSDEPPEIDPKYEPTVFVPKYQPILPTAVQKDSDAWHCWKNGGGRDCLKRNWNYEPPQISSEWDEVQPRSERKPKKQYRNSVEKLLRWIP